MFGSNQKAFADLSFLASVIFLTSAVSYVGIGSWDFDKGKKFNAATLLGIFSVCFASIYKILDVLSPVFKFCKVLSLNAFGLVALPVLSFLCAAVDLIMYSVVSDHIFDYDQGKTWFALTFIGTFTSLLFMIFSIWYYKRPVKKGLLN